MEDAKTDGKVWVRRWERGGARRKRREKIREDENKKIDGEERVRRLGRGGSGVEEEERSSRRSGRKMRERNGFINEKMKECMN